MWFGWVLFLLIGFWLGQRYADFKELMMARRVAKLIEERQRIAREQDEWNRQLEAEVRSGVR